MSEPMSDSRQVDELQSLAPVQEPSQAPGPGPWTSRLVMFLRLMAGVSMLKGLYHWSWVIGVGVQPHDVFEFHSIAWQSATVFFAVIDLVAGVGLWLAAAWGAVIWLTSIASMLALELFFPQVYGGSMLTALLEMILLALYLGLALKSAQEHPE